MARKNYKIKKSIGSLYGSSSLYFIKNKLKEYKKIIVIVENNNQALNLQEELQSFLDPESVIDIFLNYETLPYEEILEDKEILSRRIQTIINKNHPGVVITNIQAIIRKLSSNLTKSNFLREINHDVKYSRMIDLLKIMKFEKTGVIQNRGEFI